MSSLNLESYALGGDIAFELSPTALDETPTLYSHSCPKHHRSSCLFDDPKCHSPTIPCSRAREPAERTATECIQLQLPDFSSMLPSECSFLRSSAEYATEATPHTPVVLNVFEGEGLQACTSRVVLDPSWANSQEIDDEFHVDYHNMMPLDGSAHQETLQHMEQTHKEDGWLPALFPSLLSRRTLSAVMEGEHEGQDEGDQQQNCDCTCEHLGGQQPGKQQGEAGLLLSSGGQSREKQLSSIYCSSHRGSSEAVINSSGDAGAQPELAFGAATAAAAMDSGEFAVDESEVQMELSSGSVIVYSDRPACHQDGQQSQCMQFSVAAGVAHQQTHAAQQQQNDAVQQPRQQQPQQQQQQQQRENLGSVLGTDSRIDALDGLDLPAVELRVSSRTLEGGKAAAVVAPDTAQEENEWQQANRLRMQELQQQALQGSATAAAQCSQQLTYPAAEAQLLTADMRCHRASILQSLPPPPGWFARRMRQLLGCGVCSSSSSSSCSSSAVALEGLNDQEQVVLLLSLAKTGFSDDNELHVGILNAVYSAYTGHSCPAARYGAHWCEVGFQGDDPATDLRGAGMLGLLQLLYLPYHDAAAAQKLYQLSISTSQEFPLAVVGLNITRWSLTALRAGKLTRAAHKLGSYAAAANHFYCGAWYEFYARWCQGKTMREAGFVLKHLEEHCRKHPAQLLQLAAAPQKAVSAADSKAWQPT